MHVRGVSRTGRLAPMMPRDVPTRESTRVRLRPWRLDDAAIVQSVADDPLIPLITSVPTSGTLADAQSFVRRQRGLGEGAGYAFAIALTDTDEAIGHIGLWTRHLDEGRATTGYWLAASHRRRGLLTDALAVLRDWAMRCEVISRLDLFVEPWNEGSWRAAESCGFAREGLLRNWQRVGGEPKDMFVYAITR